MLLEVRNMGVAEHGEAFGTHGGRHLRSFNRGVDGLMRQTIDEVEVDASGSCLAQV